MSNHDICLTIKTQKPKILPMQYNGKSPFFL